MNIEQQNQQLRMQIQALEREREETYTKVRSVGRVVTGGGGGGLLCLLDCLRFPATYMVWLDRVANDECVFVPPSWQWCSVVIG